MVVESPMLFARSTWLTEVLAKLAATPRRQQFEQVAPFILQGILDRFDPAHLDMAVKLIQCVHPSPGKPVRSMRLTHMIGAFPSGRDILPVQFYLAGRESLAGQVLTSREATLIEDTRRPNGRPRPANRWARSTIMVPLLYGTQVAGCLTVCSPLPRSFHPSQVELLQQYATLLALTLPPEAFYAPEQISLALMPSPEVQRAFSPRFYALLMQQLTEMSIPLNMNTRVEAEKLVWQQMEDEIVALTIASEEPVEQDTTVSVPTPSQAVLLQQSSLHPPSLQLLVSPQKQQLLDELKERFVTTISHELRTPLTVLGGYLDILQEHLRKMDQEQISTLLSQAHQGYLELLSLVRTIAEAMTVSGFFSEQEKELLYLREFIQGVKEQFDPSLIQAYKIELPISRTLRVWANRQALKQVMCHLLSNVFKYVPRHTPLTIAAHYLETTSSVCVSLQDAGPGIPPEEIPLLFERFVRLRRDVASSIPGMGLGLFISKRLIEAMGGQIWVESNGQAGAGCCFCFTLPAHRL